MTTSKFNNFHRRQASSNAFRDCLHAQLETMASAELTKEVISRPVSPHKMIHITQRFDDVLRMDLLAISPRSGAFQNVAIGVFEKKDDNEYSIDELNSRLMELLEIAEEVRVELAQTQASISCSASSLSSCWTTKSSSLTSVNSRLCQAGTLANAESGPNQMEQMARQSISSLCDSLKGTINRFVSSQLSPSPSLSQSENQAVELAANQQSESSSSSVLIDQKHLDQEHCQQLWLTDKEALVERLFGNGNFRTSLFENTDETILLDYFNQFLSTSAPPFTLPSAEMQQQTNCSKSLFSFFYICEIKDFLREEKANFSSFTKADGSISIDTLLDFAHEIKVLCNLCLKLKRIPAAWKQSRSILVPKFSSRNPNRPEDFRLITVSNILYRCFTSIFAKRLKTCLTPCFSLLNKVFNANTKLGFDGFALCTEEDIFTTHEAITTVRYLINIDDNVRLAILNFDHMLESLSHEAIFGVCRRRGLSENSLLLLTTLITGHSTTLELKNGSKKSEPIAIKKGLCQDNPLSPLLFSLVLEELIQTANNSDYGLTYPRSINVKNSESDLTFATQKLAAISYTYSRKSADNDDKNLYHRHHLLLVATSDDDLQFLVNLAANFYHSIGLNIATKNPNASFTVGTSRSLELKQGDDVQAIRRCLKKENDPPTEEFYYLGVLICRNSLKVNTSALNATSELTYILERLTSTSTLRPHQKLLILREFILPAIERRLSAEDFTRDRLQSLDRNVCRSVRTFLHLSGLVENPEMTFPDAWFYLHLNLGGLGLTELRFTVPNATFETLVRLQNQAKRPDNENWLLKEITTSKWFQLVEIRKRILPALSRYQDKDGQKMALLRFSGSASGAAFKSLPCFGASAGSGGDLVNIHLRGESSTVAGRPFIEYLRLRVGDDTLVRSGDGNSKVEHRQSIQNNARSRNCLNYLQNGCCYFGNDSSLPRCRYGCVGAHESLEHVFAHCPAVEPDRTAANQKVAFALAEILQNEESFIPEYYPNESFSSAWTAYASMLLTTETPCPLTGIVVKCTSAPELIAVAPDGRRAYICTLNIIYESGKRSLKRYRGLGDYYRQETVIEAVRKKLALLGHVGAYPVPQESEEVSDEPPELEIEVYELVFGYRGAVQPRTLEFLEHVFGLTEAAIGKLLDVILGSSFALLAAFKKY